MTFSNRELKLIGEVQQLLAWHREDPCPPYEIVAGVVHELIASDADRVIPHCLALLPDSARPHLDACVDRLRSSDFEEGPVTWLGPGPSEEEKPRLKERRRAVAEAVMDSLRRFPISGEPRADLAVPVVDLFWEHLRGMRLDESSTCRAAGCDLPALWVSAFCPWHHYEEVEHRAPPDY